MSHPISPGDTVRVKGTQDVGLVKDVRGTSVWVLLGKIMWRYDCWRLERKKD